jgi:hypothetical protein
MMTDKLRAAAKAALDAMKLARGDHGTVMLAYSAIDPWLYHRVDQRLDDAIKAVEDALAEPAIKESLTVAEPEQEPMLEMNPEKREWVGLTGDEIEDLPKDKTWWEIIRAAEAKLREKNG